MPTGVHNNHTKNGGRKIGCFCGFCKTCIHRAWRKRTGRLSTRSEFEDINTYDNLIYTEEDDMLLTTKLINKFALKGWD